MILQEHPNDNIDYKQVELPSLNILDNVPWSVARIVNKIYKIHDLKK
jgi:hypothetical protein